MSIHPGLGHDFVSVQMVLTTTLVYRETTICTSWQRKLTVNAFEQLHLTVYIIEFVMGCSNTMPVLEKRPPKMAKYLSAKIKQQLFSLFMIQIPEIFIVPI